MHELADVIKDDAAPHDGVMDGKEVIVEDDEVGVLFRDGAT